MFTREAGHGARGASIQSLGFTLAIFGLAVLGLVGVPACGGREGRSKESTSSQSGATGAAGDTAFDGQGGASVVPGGGNAGEGPTADGGGTRGNDDEPGPDRGGSAGAYGTGAAGAASLVRCPHGNRVAVLGPACGDGELSAREMCDDGNVEAGDGCNSRCRIESGWVCTVEGGACSRCGNCLTEDGEECDDGNTNGGDGCSSTCRAESDYVCLLLEDYWGDVASNCVWAGECGDGRVSVVGEACDDGNADSGDGCSGDCSSVEPGYVCHEPGIDCERIASEHPHCGDGEVQPEYGEECDDGADDGSEDGCAMDCRLPYCGDGQLQPEFGERCDDGRNSGAYGECSSVCDYAPLHVADACMVLNPYCGDRVLQTESEECDDGADNGSNGHCEVDCTLGRPGYCGDGIVDVDYEECDDGNWVSCDGCSSFCGRELPVE